MSYKRQILPSVLPAGEALTAQLIGIGFRLQGDPKRQANIEDSIFAASVEGMEGDLRVLSLLVDWVDIHSGQILADRLYQLVDSNKDKRVRAFWAAVGSWKSTDSRFKRFLSLHRGKRIDLLSAGTEFQIKKKGEDPRFKGSPLRVPAGVGLRQRPSDILSPAELVRIHLNYYYRILIGSTYRADMWAQLELEPDLSAAELARRCYGSFATAWQVKREQEILRSAA